MNTKQAGGVAAPGQPPTRPVSASPATQCSSQVAAPRGAATREFDRCSFMLLPLAILLAVSESASNASSN